MYTAAVPGIARARRAEWLPCAAVAALVALVAATGVRGADYPAHLLRALLWERTGASVWNYYWYAGHPTPSYSVLTPPLSALISPFGVAACSSLAATWWFSRLTQVLIGSPTTLSANLAFSAGVVVNVVVGRVAYALGLALALGALWAWHRRRVPLALSCAVLAPLASPVAATFLAIAGVAVALEAILGRRSASSDGAPRSIHAGVAIALCAVVPIGLTTALFREPGVFPFRAGPMIMSLLVLAVLVVIGRHPVVRIAATLTAVCTLVVFVVPNPLGGNVLRLTQMVALPLVIAFARPSRRGIAAVGVCLVAAAGLAWSVQPGVSAAVRWRDDESIDPAYHRPLIAEVRERNVDGGPVGRLEIPFTATHWESVFVAPEVPYARGWERQVDMVRNAVLYDEALTLDRYHRWLLDNAVRWIAVPDVRLDASALAEADLIESENDGSGVPWLRAVWRNAHWRLYEVLDAAPIVDPPAVLVEQGPDRLVVRTDRRASVTVRYRFTPYVLASGGACLRASADGWIIADLPASGEYVFDVDPAASWRAAADDRCG
jgi:hypothetical protein